MTTVTAYVRVDENGDIIGDMILHTLLDVARHSNVDEADFNAETFQLPTGWATVLVNEPNTNLSKYDMVSAAPIAKDNNGQFVINFIIEECNDERKQYIDGYLTNESRRIRNILLTNSDWTQLPDAPLSAEKKVEWTTYRQALRDVPALAGYPVYHQMPQTPQ